MNKVDLEAPTKEEVVQLLLKQQAQLNQLQSDFEALNMKFEEKQRPPTSSKNSSQPPSLDQKGNLPTSRQLRQRGSQFGHEKHEHIFAA